MAVPKDHIKDNRNRFKSLAPATPSSGSDSTFDVFKKKQSLSGFKVKLISPVDLEKRKLDVERQKIKNIIGNNPFRVKNYVQGD